MKLRIVREMARLFLSGLFEYLQIFVALAIVLGIPVALFFGGRLLVIRYFGESTFEVFFVVAFIVVTMVFVFSSIRDLYLKAKRNIGALKE